MSDTLAAIRRLYYSATRGTIVRDFDEAVDLLKSMPSEDERERATVYMQGLSEMKRQWGSGRPADTAPRSRPGPGRSRPARKRD